MLEARRGENGQKAHSQECLCHWGSCAVSRRGGMLRRRLLEPPLLIPEIRDETI